ncbi:MAG TPA: hypothetical protein VIX91_09930 [Candidatus Acidoferrum sp.]
MFQQGENRSGFSKVFGVGLTTALVIFCSTALTAQNKKSEMSDAAVQSALQRGLPGLSMAHTASGAANLRGQGMGSGAAAHSVNMSDLPMAVHAIESEADLDHDRPLSGLTEEEYSAVKNLVARRLSAGQIGSPRSSVRSAGPALGTAAPPSVGLTSGFFAQQEVCCDPPDMSLAVGPTYILQMVNNYVAVYDKKGNLQSGFPKNADTFFNLPAGTYTTDPRAFYDWNSSRYFVLELTETNTGSPTGSPNVGAVAWAVSKTNNPTGEWWVYPNNLQQASGVCPDFPTLGHDVTDWGTDATKGGIYIGLNLWSGANDCHGDGYTDNSIFMIPKDALYKGAGYGYWYFTGLEDGGTLVDTIQPYNVTSKTTNPSSVFWVNSFNYDWGSGICSGGCNGLVVWSVSGPTTANGSHPAQPNNPFAFLTGGNGPNLAGVNMSTAHNYSLPPSASATNCKAASSPCIDTDYTFISGQVKYNAGELFGSFNTGVSGTSPAVAGPIWFDVHPVVNNNNSQITGAEERQEDCFVCGGWANNGSAFYASLQPDSENNVLLVYDFSADNVYPGMAFTSRRVTYGDSLMDGVGLYLVSGGGSGVSGRWGDYSATAPDFSNAATTLLWFSAQYAPSPSGSWGTAIGSAEYKLPTTQ